MTRSTSQRNDDIVLVKDVTLVHATDKAILVRNHDGEKVWLPKSQIEYEHAGRTITIKGPEWLMVERGLY